MSCSKLNGIWRYRKRVRLPSAERVRVFGTPARYGLANTRVGAEEAERRHIAETLNPIAPLLISPLFRDFQSVYLEHCDAKNEFSTTKAKRQILRDHLVPTFGPLPLDAITFARIEDFKNRLVRSIEQGGRGLSNKTANNILTVLRRLLQLAVKRSKLATVPEIEWLPTEPGAFDFLTFDEANALIDNADEQWRCMITVAIRCGLRQGELLGLRWSDVDLRNNVITLRQSVVRGRVKGTKSRRHRTIELGREVAAALASQRHLRGSFVFCDDYGNRLTNGECKWPLYRACTRAELRRVGWHVLRHTFASHLAMRGAMPSVIQRLMGHATLKMTERYMHLSPHVTRDAVLLLDRTSAQSVPSRARKRGSGRESA